MNLERWLRALRRRGWLVVACMLIAGISTFAFASGQKKEYTATTSLLFSDNQLGAVATGLTPAQNSPSQSQQDTNIQLVTLGDVASKTAAQMGPNWTPAEVATAITAVANGDTSLVTLSATAPTRAVAKKLANTYSNVFVGEQQLATTSAINAAQRLVTQQFNALNPQQRAQPQGIALADRAQSLATLAKLQTGDVSLVGPATAPPGPSAPKTSRDTALGLIFGLLIGLAIAFLLERLDRRIRDPKDLEAVYQFPLLATVPERAQYEVLTTLGHTKRSSTPTIYDEVFNLLRSYLRYFSVDRDLRTLLVISAGPGEGKTTVSYNLAKAAAALGSRVMLVEADLRRGTMIGPLVGRADPGLSDVLIGDVPMEDAICSIEIGATGVLDVLVAGEAPPPNPGELIESHAMEAVLERARAGYDLVVIDTPPLTLVADAIPLLTKVDGVIVVGRVGKSRRDAAEQLRKRLTSLRAPVLGIVANGLRRADTTAYRGRYGYGYAYGARPPADPESINGSAPLAETPQDVHETA